MGHGLFFCAVLAVSLPFQMSHAADADADADDIVILSVKPRSPDVKPIAVAVSAKGQETVASGPADRAGPVPAGVQVSTRAADQERRLR
jgi:hypothetical protein